VTERETLGRLPLCHGLRGIKFVLWKPPTGLGGIDLGKWISVHDGTCEMEQASVRLQNSGQGRPRQGAMYGCPNRRIPAFSAVGVRSEMVARWAITGPPSLSSTHTASHCRHHSIEVRNSDTQVSRNSKAAKALGMQTIRKGSFLQYIGGSRSAIPYFLYWCPIGGSLDAIKSLEFISGTNMESISTGVGTLTSRSKM
jgi:hypothetical protein